MKSLIKYLRVYGVQIKNNWVREAVYRTNFLTALATDAVWFFVEFSFFSIIYANTDQIAGWTKPQVFFFLGVFFASDAFCTILFQRNFWMFSDLVNKAELDILLTKPVHPLFLALTRWINLTAVFNVVLGFFVILTYMDEAGFHPSFFNWFQLLGWIVIGVLTQLLVRFAFSIWIFWTDRSFALARLYYQFFAFATKPDTIYPMVIRYMVMTVLPFAFISSFPTRSLLYGLQTSELLLLFVVLIAFLLFDITLWRKGLKRYQSASS